MRARSHGFLRRARLHPRELGRHRLADDHGARVAQRRNARAVAVSLKAREQRRTVLRGHVDGFDDVLDPDRHAVDRRKRLARTPALGGTIRGAPCAGKIERDESADLRLPGVKLGDAALEELTRRIFSICEIRRHGKKRPHPGFHRVQTHAPAPHSLSCPRTRASRRAFDHSLDSRLRGNDTRSSAISRGSAPYAGAAAGASRGRMARMIAFSASTTRKKIRPPRNNHGQTPSGIASVSNTDCSGGA